MLIFCTEMCKGYNLSPQKMNIKLLGTCYVQCRLFHHFFMSSVFGHESVSDVGHANWPLLVGCAARSWPPKVS